MHSVRTEDPGVVVIVWKAVTNGMTSFLLWIGYLELTTYCGILAYRWMHLFVMKVNFVP